MAGSPAQKKPLEDALVGLIIGSFDGGLMSDVDPTDLPISASPDCENVRFSSMGSLEGRDGYSLVQQVAEGGRIDGWCKFFDSADNPCLVAFVGGDLIDITNARTFSSVYASGVDVTCTPFLGELVYSDGETIHDDGTNQSGQRYYDPAGNTEGMNISSGLALSMGPPAAKWLTTYQGSILAGNCKLTDGTARPDSVYACNVADRTTWLGAQEHPVGYSEGGKITCLVPFSLSTDSISPTRTVFVGKDGTQIYALKGSVGSFEEIQIRASVGVLDPYSVSTIPIGDGAVVVFLGTDKQIWVTNGVTAQPLSDQKIRKELNQWITQRIAEDPAVRFYAARDFAHYMYILNVGGGRHYCYDWNRQTFTRYRGWPDGPMIEDRDAVLQQILHCFSVVDETVKQYKLDDGTSDIGTAIAPYWKSGYLRGSATDSGGNAGDPTMDKLWYWAVLEFSTDTGQYQINFTSNRGRGPSTTVLFEGEDVPEADPDGGVWDESEWDEANWQEGGLFGTYTEYRRKKRIKYTAANGRLGVLQCQDIQVEIRLQDGNSGHFEIRNLTIKLSPTRGMRRV